MEKKKFWSQKKKFQLWYRYRNWTLVFVSNTKTWFQSYTTPGSCILSTIFTKLCGLPFKDLPKNSQKKTLTIFNSFPEHLRFWMVLKKKFFWDDKTFFLALAWVEVMKLTNFSLLLDLQGLFYWGQLPGHGL